jgi:branched-chain amino acid aminotransferase
MPRVRSLPYWERSEETAWRRPRPPTPPPASLDAGLIWFDGKIVPQEQAVVSVLTHAMHYGTSVFEGIRAYETARGAAVFRLREHSQRLLDSAKILGMRPTWTVEQIDGRSSTPSAANARKSCYIRPLIWYGPESLGVNPAKNLLHFMVATLPWGIYLGEEAVRKGAKLHDVVLAPLVGRHHADQGEGRRQLRQLGAGQPRGARERLRRGAAARQGGLRRRGLGREHLLPQGRHPLRHRPLGQPARHHPRHRDPAGARHGHPGRETMAVRDELYTADEVFMVGTAAEVTPIASIDRRPIGAGVAGPVLAGDARALPAGGPGQLPEYDRWLTYVDG